MKGRNFVANANMLVILGTSFSKYRDFKMPSTCVNQKLHKSEKLDQTTANANQVNKSEIQKVFSGCMSKILERHTTEHNLIKTILKDNGKNMDFI